MSNTKEELIKNSENEKSKRFLEFTQIFRNLLENNKSKIEFAVCYKFLKKCYDEGDFLVTQYIKIIKDYDGNAEENMLSLEEYNKFYNIFNTFIRTNNEDEYREKTLRNYLDSFENIDLNDYGKIYRGEDKKRKQNLSKSDTTNDSIKNLMRPESVPNVSNNFDMLQYYTAGKVRNKDRQLIFVNHVGDSFFMKAEAFLDLLTNLGKQRLVKKYNKKKEGYIGGEVVGVVNFENQAYEFLLGFGPQNQLITKESKLQVHKYTLHKQRIDLYEQLLKFELLEDKEFLKLLNEADHNTYRRYQIDLKKCFEEQNKSSKSTK